MPRLRPEGYCICTPLGRLLPQTFSYFTAASPVSVELASSYAWVSAEEHTGNNRTILQAQGYKLCEAVVRPSGEEG